TYIAIWRTRLTATVERPGLRNSLPETPNSAATMSITPSHAAAIHSCDGCHRPGGEALSAAEEPDPGLRSGTADCRSGLAAPLRFRPSSFFLAAVFLTNTPSIIGICSYIKAEDRSEQIRNKYLSPNNQRLAFIRIFPAVHSRPGIVSPPPPSPPG